ncbi:MAG: hypothetical protein KAI47_18060, partial [Deltaproteobacteria bacterium]|nr:hypothetical protein [Deltaproteobacteria bacterium]
ADVIAPAEDEIPVAKVALRKVRKSQRFVAKERVRGKLSEPEIGASKAPVDLGVFDELVPDLFDKEGEGGTHPAEDEVEAGDFLAVPSVEETFPRSAIFDGLDEVDDLNVPVPELAPISESLYAFDINDLDAPEFGEAAPASEGYWQVTRAALRRVVTTADSTARAAEAELAAGAVAERLDNLDDALQHYQDVLAHQPKNAGALYALWCLHITRGMEGEAMALIDPIADLHGKSGEGLRILRDDVLWTQDVQIAEKLQNAEEGGGGRDAGKTIRELTLQADLAVAEGDRLKQDIALERLANAIENAGLRSALEVHRGRLAEIEGKAEKAYDVYERALKAAPSLAAWEGLGRCATVSGDKKLLARSIEGGAALWGPWEALRRRRHVALIRAGAAEGDTLALLGDALDLNGEDLATREFLARLRRERGLLPDAEADLIDLVRLLPSARGRAQATYEAGVLAEARGEGSIAIGHYEIALHNKTDHTFAADALARLKLDDPDPLVRLDAQEIAGDASVGGSAALHYLAAAVLAASNEQEERARPLFEKALAADPQCTLAREALTRSLAKVPDLEALVSLLDASVSAAPDDPEKVAIWTEHAAWACERRHDTAGALERYQNLVEMNPQRLSPHHNVQRCLHRLERVEGLLEALAAEAALYEGKEARDIWRRHADLLARENRWDAAKESYLRAADNGEPWGLWGTIRSAARDETPDVLATAYERLEEGLDTEHGLVAVLQLRLGMLREGTLDDLPGGLLAYEAATMGDHPALGAKAGVRRLRRRQGDPNLLREDLRSRLEKAPNNAERFALTVALGEMLRHQDADKVETEKLFRRALDQRPKHPVPRRALDVLYQDSGAWQALSDLIFTQLAEVEDPQVRVMLFERLAARDVRRDDMVSAALTYDSVLELDPGNIYALRFLARRYIKEERWRDLVIVLRTEAERAAPEDQSAIWLELAHLGDVHPTATSVSPALDEDSPLYLTSDLLVNAADNEDD